MRCPLCKGETKEALIRYLQELDGRVVIIENVPADICAQCGEQLIKPEIAQKIQSLVWKGTAPKRKTQVPVYDLSEVG